MVLAINLDSQDLFLQFSKMGIINIFYANINAFCAILKYANKKALCLISIAAKKLFH